MNDHPNDLLPAFVLDALDGDEARHVARHLQDCSVCRAEVASFRALVDLMPYSVLDQAPHERIKRQLFARIAAAREDDVAAHALPTAAPTSRASSVAASHDRRPPHLPQPAYPPPPRVWRWAQLALVLVVGLAFVLGAMMVDAQRRLSVAQTALHDSQQTMALAQTQLTEQQQIVALLSDPQSHNLALTGEQAGVQGRFVTHADDTRTVLLVSGLPPPPPTKVYQFWFAEGTRPLPARTFTVGGTNTAELLLTAPLPLNRITQVMVTVEPTGGSATPSDEIVLSAPL